ncbi:MAG: methylmalonyl-CoA epimerase [Calditrichia bacterium]
MLEKIDHVGVAVKSLDDIKQLFLLVFGAKPAFEEVVEDQRVKVAGFKVGESNIEFLEPLSEDSPIAKYIEKKGEGLHHIAVGVDDIRNALSKMKSNNIRLIDEEPRKGAEGKSIAFAHPKSLHGILLELSQE